MRQLIHKGLRLGLRLGLGVYRTRSIGDCKLRLNLMDEFQLNMFRGAYEPPLVELLRRTLRPGDVYVDVGAQLGYTAALAWESVKPEGRLILFEPDPRLAAALRRHLAPLLARGETTCRLEEIACSEAAGEAELHLSPILGQSRIPESRPGSSKPIGVRVAADRLDTRLSEIAAQQIRLLKMDVEGHEVQALAGLERVLAHSRIDYLCVEWNDLLLWKQNLHAAHLHSVVARHGYVGVHEDGRPITRGSLEPQHPSSENLYYARSAELMRSLFPEYVECADGFAPEELERYSRDARVGDSLTRRAMVAMGLARSGQLDRAIALAEKLQGDPPQWTPLLGHLAHWYLAARQEQNACSQFATYLRFYPDDGDARTHLERLRATTAHVGSR